MNPLIKIPDSMQWPRHIGESFRLKIVQTLHRVPYDTRIAALKDALDDARSRVESLTLRWEVLEARSVASG